MGCGQFMLGAIHLLMTSLLGALRGDGVTSLVLIGKWTEKSDFLSSVFM